jgi:hypothetical protein
VTASFIKELLRRAALVAAEEDSGGGAADAPIRVTDAHISAALDELLGARSALTQILLGGGPSGGGPGRQHQAAARTANGPAG